MESVRVTGYGLMESVRVTGYGLNPSDRWSQEPVIDMRHSFWFMDSYKLHTFFTMDEKRNRITGQFADWNQHQARKGTEGWEEKKERQERRTSGEYIQGNSWRQEPFSSLIPHRTSKWFHPRLDTRFPWMWSMLHSILSLDRIHVHQIHLLAWVVIYWILIPSL